MFLKCLGKASFSSKILFLVFGLDTPLSVLYNVTRGPEDSQSLFVFWFRRLRDLSFCSYGILWIALGFATLDCPRIFFTLMSQMNLHGPFEVD